MNGIPLRLLIVEDVEDDMLLVLRELRAGGFDTSALRVEDEATMRTALVEHDWDIVISDYSMPRFDALSALRTLRDSGRELPFIIVSGAVGESRAVDAMVAGAAEFVPKESLPRIVRAVQRALAQAKSRVDQRSAEEALRHSEARFRTLVASMDAMVFTVDRDGRYDSMTGRGLERLRIEPDAWLGRSVRDVLPLPVALLHEEAYRRALFGETVQLSWELQRGERTMTLHTTVTPMHNEPSVAGVPAGIPAGHRGPDVVGLVGVTRDITEEKNVQAQLLVSDRMASVGTLAAGIAHEINNPLASAIANIETALGEVDELESVQGVAGLQSIREELIDVRTATERVRQIVVDLRVFSRSAEPARAPTDIVKVLESSLRLTWNEIRHRARLVRDFQPVPSVDGNESRLGQVFVNLLVNAAQAIPLGRADEHVVRVTTRHEPAQDGGPGRVIIEIIDSGEGMAPQVLARLFTPFFTTKSVGEGTGLGLSICHRIVTAHGGEIRVESKVGAGTTFRIILVATSMQPAVLPEITAVARVGPLPGAVRGRILVVDDEPLIGKAVSRALSREHEVEVLAHARIALARLRAGEHFDIVLCDLMMPEMTGMELFEEVSKFSEEAASRIVFLTGGAFTAQARAFIDDTKNLVLDKPFDPKKLRAVIEVLLKKG